MTTRRQLFEAYHKTAGYFAGFFAVGALASGLMQFPMPVLTGAIIIAVFAILGLCIVLEYKGLRYDGYRAAHGNNPDHPYNPGPKRFVTKFVAAPRNQEYDQFQPINITATVWHFCSAAQLSLKVNHYD